MSARVTIDFGIDLGTANARVAQLKGTTVEVLRNADNTENIPSAVWVDKEGKLRVGSEAKARLAGDPESVVSGFTLHLGETAWRASVRNGRRFTAEDLTAEVFKALREVARQRTAEDLEAAVVTVPAAVGSGRSPQADAVARAAKQAGLRQVQFLGESEAAVSAYGFQSVGSRVSWLVYDFGSSGFRATVVQFVNGRLHIVDRVTDSGLTATSIDTAIVDDLLVPAVRGAHRPPDFGEGSAQWHSAMARLRFEAEKAKIRVSESGLPAKISIDRLFDNRRGQPVGFEYELTLEELEHLVGGPVTRSIALCREVFARNRQSVERIVLVGGTTLIPFLQESLLEALRIPLLSEIDPLTVTARGAAVFAGSRLLEPEVPPPTKTGRVGTRQAPAEITLSSDAGGSTRARSTTDVPQLKSNPKFLRALVYGLGAAVIVLALLAVFVFGVGKDDQAGGVAAKNTSTTSPTTTRHGSTTTARTTTTTVPTTTTRSTTTTTRRVTTTSTTLTTTTQTPLTTTATTATTTTAAPVYTVGGVGPAGGLIFYDKGDDTGGWRYLEVAPASTEWSSMAWCGPGTVVSGARGTKLGTGSQNTTALVAVLGAGNTYAAQLCDGLSFGGFSDWFLPSVDELALMGNRLQLSSHDSRFGLQADTYWSSSEKDATSVWTFNVGGSRDNEDGLARVRAVRAFGGGGMN